MKTKTFDSVQMMRELRDALSRDLENLSPEEQRRLIRERAEKVWQTIGTSAKNDRQ